ncbi:MAG: glycosyltransferase family 2 protein [Actinomycetota bacterium]|nr:glycosyltransferase family 2 protein [Actinomycetota bacterium]
MLSVVVPMFDEESVLPHTLPRMRAVLDGMGEPYELICVDDGSTDQTAGLLRVARAGWPELRLVRLRANAGHQAALTAGLDVALGDYVVTIDADLQDPPELIPTLLERARAGADVVYAVRNDRRSDSAFKRITAGLYYRIARRVAGPQMRAHAGDYRLISRAAVEALRSLPERHRVYRLLIPWLGFPSATVEYTRSARAAGTTKYPLSKMVRLAADSITSFTAAPLRIATWLGAGGFAVCLLLGTSAIGAYFAGVTVPGWASVTVALLFVGAVQLLCLGLLGEYVGRLFSETQRRPLYFIAEDTGMPAVDHHRIAVDDPRR